MNEWLKRAGPIALMCACVVFLAASQSSAIIVIDDFSCGAMTTKLEVDDVTTQDSISQPSLSCAIGNQRDLVLDFIKDGGLNGAEAFVQGGSLIYNNGSGVESELKAKYGMAGDLNANLIADGSFGIDVFFVDSDQGAQVKVTVTEDGSSVSVTKDTPSGSGASSLTFLYSEFGLAFTSVDQIEFLFTNRDGTAAVDYEVDLFATHIPEPVTMLGMFLGLGSVGAYIRRRRMS